MMNIHASGEDYLEAIFVLQKKKGMVRSVDLAQHMGYSKPSISHAVGLLKKEGLLTVDTDGYLHLTDAGRENDNGIDLVLSAEVDVAQKVHRPLGVGHDPGKGQVDQKTPERDGHQQQRLEALADGEVKENQGDDQHDQIASPHRREQHGKTRIVHQVA